MKAALFFTVAAFLCGAALADVVNRSAEEGISVTVVGTLKTGVVAIGGETTGTTIKVKGITWELDFGKNDELKKAAEALDGKKVIVQGSLERRTGVEVKERWIVTVKTMMPGDQ